MTNIDQHKILQSHNKYQTFTRQIKVKNAQQKHEMTRSFGENLQ